MKPKERAHSKFSASGSERWLNCAASVELEAGLESKDTVWSLEGTHAHKGLELYLKGTLDLKMGKFNEWKKHKDTNKTMIGHVINAGDLIIDLAIKEKAVLIPERKVYNKEIHPEMFGTADATLVRVFSRLHVLDFKYGAGHVVNPEENTQGLQYALACAEEYDWNFSEVVIHIIQPRAGNKGHKKWVVPMEELRNKWLPLFKKGVARVERGGNKPQQGSWCYWCKAKATCPAKVKVRQDKIKDKFKNNPIGKGA